MRFSGRLLALLMMLVFLLAFPVRADVPFLSVSSGWDLSDTPLEVALTAEVSAHMPFDEDRLAMLLPITERLGMRIVTGADAGNVTISFDEKELLTLATRQNQVQLSNLPGVTYTAQEDPLNLLLGTEVVTESLDFFGLRGDAETLLNDGAMLLKAIPEAFSSYGRKTSGKTTVSGMGTAQYRYDYTVPAADVAAMQQTLLTLCPDGWLREMIGSLTFSGKQLLRVYYTKDGVLLRAEYTGSCGYGEDIRNANLIWRMRRDSVAYKDDITLRTPAKTGTDKNNLTFLRTVETTKNGATQMTGEFTYTVTRAGQSDVRKGEFDITNTHSDIADVLTGKINLRHLPAGDNKYDQVEFEPDLSISGDRDTPIITGTLIVREKWGKGIREEAKLHIDVKRAEEISWQDTPTVIDLDRLSTEALAQEQLRVASATATALVRPLILSLGEDAQWFFRDLTEEQIQNIIKAAQTAEN